MKKYEFRSAGFSDGFHMFIDDVDTGVTCDSFVSYPIEHPVSKKKHSIIVMSRNGTHGVEYCWFVLGSDEPKSWHNVIIGPPFDANETGVTRMVGLSSFFAKWPAEEAELAQ